MTATMIAADAPIKLAMIVALGCRLAFKALMMSVFTLSIFSSILRTRSSQKLLDTKSLEFLRLLSVDHHP